MSNFSPVIAIQFSEIIHLPSCGKKINISAIFQFSEDVALSAQDILHTEICTCESNAIIS